MGQLGEGVSGMYRRVATLLILRVLIFGVVWTLFGPLAVPMLRAAISFIVALGGAAIIGYLAYDWPKDLSAYRLLIKTGLERCGGFFRGKFIL